MGVRDMKKFIEEKNYWKKVSIDVAVEEWKRRNPDEKPIIIVDPASVAFRDAVSVSRGHYNSGELNRFDKILQNWKNKLTNLDVQLVFFKSWGVPKNKAYEFIFVEDGKIQEWMQFYDMIERGESASSIFDACREIRWILFYSLLKNSSPILSKHAEHKQSSVGRDVNQETARFATANNVLAVLTENTDFMIFDGNWKFWSFSEIDLDGFIITEYDRLMLNKELMLTFEQRPLFATLMGNSYTRKYYRELQQFHRGLWRGTCRDKLYNIAQYIRKMFNARDFTLDDIDEIANIVANDVFGNECNAEKRQVIIDSIRSYDVNSETVDIASEDDPNVQLRSTNLQWNRAYTRYDIEVMQRLKWIYIPGDGGQQSKQLNDYFTEMVRKQVGLVNPDCVDGTFKLVTKKSFEESYRICDETPIFPHFAVPPLNKFYGDETDEESLAVRWNVLAWLLTISDAQKNALRSCDKNFRAACATLLTLVQQRIFSIEEADSILVAEKMGRDDCVPWAPLIEPMNAHHVRTALCYVSCYVHVTLAFKIAGLPDMLPELTKFDFIFYQNLMAADQLDEASVVSISQYRIYIE